jgi:hypothetical protein
MQKFVNFEICISLLLNDCIETLKQVRKVIRIGAADAYTCVFLFAAVKHYIFCILFTFISKYLSGITSH